MIKVTATRPGFYGKLRAEGEEFEIKDSSELGTWMKRADGQGEFDPLDEPVRKPRDPAPHNDPTIGEDVTDTLDVRDVGRSGKPGKK